MFRPWFIAGSLIAPLCMPTLSAASPDTQLTTAKEADASTPSWIKQQIPAPTGVAQAPVQPEPPAIPAWVKERLAPPLAVDPPTPPEPPPLPSWIKSLPATENNAMSQETGMQHNDSKALAEVPANKTASPAEPATALSNEKEAKQTLFESPIPGEATSAESESLIAAPAVPFGPSPLPPTHTPWQLPYGGWPRPYWGWQPGWGPGGNNWRGNEWQHGYSYGDGRADTYGDGRGYGYGYQGHHPYGPTPLFRPPPPPVGPVAPPVNE